MGDLSPFYLESRQARQNASDAEAGSALLAQYGYAPMPSAPAEPTTGELSVSTDASKIDTSKLGQRPRTGPSAPPPGLRLEGTDALARQATAREASPGEVGMVGVPTTTRDRFVDLMTELLANTDNPERYTKEVVELFQKDPREMSVGLQQLLTGLGLSQPFVNSTMRLAHKSVEEAGGPEWLATTAEMLAGAVVPSRMAVAGARTGFRPSAKFGIAAIERLRRDLPHEFSATELGRFLSHDLETAGGFTLCRRFNA
jgi:hypothetical protein